MRYLNLISLTFCSLTLAQVDNDFIAVRFTVKTLRRLADHLHRPSCTAPMSTNLMFFGTVVST